MTIPKEDVLVAQLTVTGYPARHNVLKEMAGEIQTQQLRGVNTEDQTLVTYPPIRRQWTTQFLAWHPWLKTVIIQQLESVCWTAPVRQTLQTWFDAFRFETSAINLGNIYNMDEFWFCYWYRTIKSSHC